MTAKLKAQIVEKNKAIIEANSNAALIAQELQKKNEMISQLENQLFYAKAHTPLKKYFAIDDAS